MRFVSVAMDAQGWPRVSQFVKKAGLEFDAVVDREGKLWKHLDFNVVPLQFYFDESGRLVYQSKGKAEGQVLDRLDQALSLTRLPAGTTASPLTTAASGEGTQAQLLFKRGVAEFDAGKRELALATWREALALEPNNWLIRKQIWALMEPGRFYDGDIDSGWQRELMAAGDVP